MEEMVGSVRGEEVMPGGGGAAGMPRGDKALKGEIRGKVLAWEGLHGGGAGVVAVVEPFLDAGTVVGHSRAETHWRLHHV